jgi:hypothetical protein
MPLTKGSMPMKPSSGLFAAMWQEMLAAAEADLELNCRNVRLEHRAQVLRERPAVEVDAKVDAKS